VHPLLVHKESAILICAKTSMSADVIGTTKLYIDYSLHFVKTSVFVNLIYGEERLCLLF
jgi:hypothetical protein